MSAETLQFQQGSCPNLVFVNRDLTEMVLGFSKKARKYKFPGGKIELIDVPTPMQLARMEAYNLAATDEDKKRIREYVTAENCARRELFNESGITDEQVECRIKLSYERTFKGGSVKQYYFLVLLKERIELPRNIIEAEEMDPSDYYPTIKVLLGGESGKRINPYHTLSLFKALQELRDAASLEDSKKKKYEPFLEGTALSQLLHNVDTALKSISESFTIDSVERDLAEMIDNGEI